MIIYGSKGALIQSSQLTKLCASHESPLVNGLGFKLTTVQKQIKYKTTPLLLAP